MLNNCNCNCNWISCNWPQPWHLHLVPYRMASWFTSIVKVPSCEPEKGTKSRLFNLDITSSPSLNIALSHTRYHYKTVAPYFKLRWLIRSMARSVVLPYLNLLLHGRKLIFRKVPLIQYIRQRGFYSSRYLKPSWHRRRSSNTDTSCTYRLSSYTPADPSFSPPIIMSSRWNHTVVLVIALAAPVWQRSGDFVLS